MTGRAVPAPAPLAFAARMALWIVGLLGLLRLAWVQKHLLVPFAGLQHRLACGITGAPDDAVVVDVSCTGADAMALCLGAILAFPASWRRRLAGCALGLALIAILNTARIGTLSLLVANRDLFRLLHLYLWPAAIIVAASGFAFLWMSAAGSERGVAGAARSLVGSGGPWRRFLALTALFVALYYAASGWFLHSGWLLAVARGAAGAAGLLMSALGAPAEVVGNQLTTAHGAWVVTPHCVATPLIAVYLAAVLALALSPLQRALALVAAAPLFLLLATLRLLVLALPQSLVGGSHGVAVHAFYQLVVAVLSVLVVARLQFTSGWRAAVTRALPAVGIGAAAATVVAAGYAAGVRPLLEGIAETGHFGHGWVDAQGALSLLPASHVGLFAALLWLRRRRADGFVLAAAWLVLLGSLGAAVVGFGELARHLSVEPPVVLIRALALLVPLLLAAALDRYGSSARAAPRRAAAPQPG